MTDHEAIATLEDFIICREADGLETGFLRRVLTLARRGLEKPAMDLESVAKIIDGRGWDDECTAKPETKEAIRKHCRAVARRILSLHPSAAVPEWRGIESAPLEVYGHLWSPDTPDRTDHTGHVYEYSSGERGVSSTSRGVRFTHWMPLPTAPLTLARAGLAGGDLQKMQTTHPSAAVPEWNFDITAAPCDGNSVVLGSPTWEGVTTREWSSAERRDRDLSNWIDPPTCWMRPALPAPPSIADTGKGEDDAD